MIDFNSTKLFVFLPTNIEGLIMSTLLRRGTGAALFFICTLCWSNDDIYVEIPNLEGDSENKYQQ